MVSTPPPARTREHSGSREWTLLAQLGAAQRTHPRPEAGEKIPAPASETGASRHIPELDGIRGIAILLVLVYHFGSNAGMRPTGLDGIAGNFVRLGWVGVDLFFVLSGCLITGVLLNAKGSPGYLRTFYMRRVLRIFPLYYFTVILFFWIVPLASRHIPGDWPKIGSDEQIWYWLHVSNWRTAFAPYVYPQVNHLWSLSIEEQFYLVWPFVVLLCSEIGLVWTCGALVLISCGLRNLPEFQAIASTHPDFLYRLTPFRIEPLALGSCLPLLMRNARMRVIARRGVGWVLFAGFGVFLAVVLAPSGGPAAHTALMTRLGYSAVGAVFASLIFYALLHSGSTQLFARTLRFRGLTRLGKYSYAMYVIHFPISGLVPAWALRVIPYNSVPYSSWEIGALLISIVSGVGVTYVLALCSWNLVEKPFLNLKARFSYGEARTPKQVPQYAVLPPLPTFDAPATNNTVGDAALELLH